MIYKDFKGLKLSMLGFGAMRLPITGQDETKPNEAEVYEMADYALSRGVNYFDTAWGYHGGNSEITMGRALARHDRKSFYLASKFPGYDLSNMGRVEEIFEKQLEKCGVDYFDFYLFHNVCEMNINEYLDEKYKIRDYLTEQRDKGRIKHLGFSAHGDVKTISRFLDAYGSDMEFGQLQINWVDWKFQNAKEKVRLLDERSVPVWVMEPLRGGKLARLADEDAEKLKALRAHETITGWSFRYIQSIPTAVVVLSGMSNMAQLKENIATFETDEPLNEKERGALYGIADDMTSRTSVPCTGCRYCTSHCPRGLDIPMLLGLYNEHVFTGGGFRAPMSLMAIPKDKHPQACLNCKSCEAVCPQQIKISDVFADFGKRLA